MKKWLWDRMKEIMKVGSEGRNEHRMNEMKEEIKERINKGNKEWMNKIKDVMQGSTN